MMLLKRFANENRLPHSPTQVGALAVDVPTLAKPNSQQNKNQKVNENDQ
jgi:hypothetical protein